ncbi:SDR family NAD(P)-dependent oxidoreductase [Pyxidicoccus sp. 3LG]
MKLAETAQRHPESLPAATPLSPEEVRQVTNLLERIAVDRHLLATLSEDDRIAFMAAAGRVVNPDRTAMSRMAKALRKDRKQAKQKHDREVRASTEIRTLRRSAVFTVPQLPPPPPTEQPERELANPRNCYVCKGEYRKLHFFYDTLCIECANFNYAKRTQRAALDGKVALITGARVKIGYQASLMLLRSGARVIATTRFPMDSAERYAREPDFADWSHRLHIHGLDLRHAPSVELFTKYVEQTYPRLDILINNAAQTVRRPPGFYAHLLDGELRRFDALPDTLRPLLAGHEACVNALRPALGAGGSSGSELTTTWRSSDPALGIHSSAALSLLPYTTEQEGDVQALFPQGRLDADLQQVDLRDTNSWRLKLAEVQTAEMLEVHLVNAVAPFILCGKLKPLMMRDRSSPGHIVNVSAMEGSFSRGTKTDKHPHTNMAKAALNMMTLTSAPDYAKDGIYMNAVDTGWVTDEDPAQHAERKVRELDFQPPLDIVDGAARVVDPVISSENTGQYVYGNFFKDYRHTAW